MGRGVVVRGEYYGVYRYMLLRTSLRDLVVGKAMEYTNMHGVEVVEERLMVKDLIFVYAQTTTDTQTKDTCTVDTHQQRPNGNNGNGNHGIGTTARINNGTETTERKQRNGNNGTETTARKQPHGDNGTARNGIETTERIVTAQKHQREREWVW